MASQHNFNEDQKLDMRIANARAVVRNAKGEKEKYVTTKEKQNLVVAFGGYPVTLAKVTIFIEEHRRGERNVANGKPRGYRGEARVKKRKKKKVDLDETDDDERMKESKRKSGWGGATTGNSASTSVPTPSAEVLARAENALLLLLTEKAERLRAQSQS